MSKYRSPAKLKDWDFSRVRVVEEGPKIEYSRVVDSYLERNKMPLD